MGVDAAGAHFLAFARTAGVDFTTTLTIGRQSRFDPVERIVDAMGSFGIVEDHGALASALAVADRFADPVFEALGAQLVEALDLSSFEGATVLYDLNDPIPEDFVRRWHSVVDGGATEHVFNFPVALENTMRLVAPGGHLISIVPANQQLGHGFYQLSPEVYFRSLVPANGFEIEGLYLHEQRLRSTWYRLEDPADAGRRLTSVTWGKADLFVLARRVGEAGLRQRPQQHDYEEAWGSRTTPTTATPTRGAEVRRRLYHLLGPTVGSALQAGRQLVASPSAQGRHPVDLPALASRASVHPH